MIHAFRGCELDEELFQLRRRGRVVKLEPKAFDVLLYLLRSRDRVVSKDELLDAVWPDVAVSESVLPSCVGAVRKALGDDRARSRVIQTVHGRGYRFVAPVEAVGRPEGPGRPDPTEAAASAFVGREAAMGRLRRGLDAALAGSGRTLLLSGEPGIGKTRTAQEFAVEARERGATVRTGRCHEGEGAPALWPWVRALRECVAEADPETLAADLGPGAAEIAELVPELRARLPDTPPAGAAADDDQARFRLFDSVAHFLRRQSERSPLVLVLDDLHWADEASLQLVHFLTGELRESRLLVVGTYRDVEVRRGRPLADALGALAREPACDRVPLRGLGEAEAARFVEALLGEPPPERLATTVWELTDGNPFFIQEMVGLLASEGGVETFESEGPRSLALPQSVRAAVGRRLDALSDECNRLLRVASVLGREFRAALLEPVADLPRERVLALLDDAAEAGVIAPAPEGTEAFGTWAFQHALVRQTLVDELDTLERVRLHRRAGEALERSCGAHPDPNLAELAHHFFQAAVGGDPDKAIRYCEAAAARAHRLYAYEEGARLYERALSALELCAPPDETRRCELLLRYGEARRISGERERSREAFTGAAGIARRIGRRDLLARAALGARAFEMGSPVDEETRALVEEALAALGEEHPALRARLLSCMVGMEPWSRSMERRQELSREALRLARSADDRDALKDAYFARLWSCAGPDCIDERLAIAREIVEVADRFGDATLAASAQYARHGAHLLRGEIEEADRALAAFERLAGELRQPLYLFDVRVWKGSRAMARGAFDEAESHMRGAQVYAGRTGTSYGHFIFAGQMFLLRGERGDAQAGEERELLFGEMMELPYSWTPAVRAGLAHTHFNEGDEDRARRELAELAREVRDLPRDEHWLPCIGTLGKLSSALDDAPHAALLYELVEPYADLMLIHDILRANVGSAAAVLGGLATVLGRHDEAEAHFERAMALETAADARVALLDSQAGLARLLARRAGNGDAARARALIAGVRASWGQLGVRGNRRVERLLAEAESSLNP